MFAIRNYLSSAVHTNLCSFWVYFIIFGAVVYVTVIGTIGTQLVCDLFDSQTQPLALRFFFFRSKTIDRTYSVLILNFYLRPNSDRARK